MNLLDASILPIRRLVPGDRAPSDGGGNYIPTDGPKLTPDGGAAPPPADPPKRTIAPPATGRDTGTPSSGLPSIIPGGIYSAHGPPQGLTCQAGQVPTEVPAGSGFWRCSAGSQGTVATPDPVAKNPTPITPDPFGSGAPTAGPSNAPASGTGNDPINRLIDLVASQYAGAGVKGDTGGLAATPVTGVTSDGSTDSTSSGLPAGAIFVILLLVAGVAYWLYKRSKKKAA